MGLGLNFCFDNRERLIHHFCELRKRTEGRERNWCCREEEEERKRKKTVAHDNDRVCTTDGAAPIRTRLSVEINPGTSLSRAESWVLLLIIIYRTAASRLRYLKERPFNKGLNRFASSSAVSTRQTSSPLGGLFGWLVGDRSKSLPSDFPFPGVSLPSPLPDFVEPDLRVLNEHPQVLSISAFNNIYDDTGLFGIQATTGSNFVSKAIDIAANELIAIGTAGEVDQLQLDRAKQATKSAILMNLESRMDSSEDIGRQILTYGER